jgi:epsilon-lactone hydrolase
MKSQILLGSVVLVCVLPLYSQGQPPRHSVVVDDDGTVHFPAMNIPVSSFLSPEAKAYVTQHLKDMQNPKMAAQENGIPRFMKGYIERQRALYPVDRIDTKIAGVHTYVYTPKAGISAPNRNRVLINLHGGGFSGCWPACAELESMPIAALAGVYKI